MRCRHCLLYSANENGSGAKCAIFGGCWDSDFLYYSNSGAVVGCYLEVCYIKKVAAQKGIKKQTQIKRV